MRLPSSFFRLILGLGFLPCSIGLGLWFILATNGVAAEMEFRGLASMVGLLRVVVWLQALVLGSAGSILIWEGGRK